MSSDTQTELLSRVAKGDETAFRQLFDYYWDRVYLVAFTLTKSPESSKEMAQDVFLKIWLKRDLLMEVQQFESWLFITARNHILNQLRKKSHDSHFLRGLEAHFAGSAAITPEQEFLLKETQDLVAQAVQQMPQRQREIYTLSRKEGLDTATIGRRLGISRLTVKSHLTRALQHIRQHIRPFPDKFFFFLLLLPPSFVCL